VVVAPVETWISTSSITGPINLDKLDHRANSITGPIS